MSIGDVDMSNWHDAIGFIPPKRSDFEYTIPSRFGVPIVEPRRTLVIAEGHLDSVELESKGITSISLGYTFTHRELQAMKRERFEPGDRKLHAPDRRRPKRVAKKIRKRYGAQHYRDAVRCFEAQAKQAARAGKLEREIIALQRRVHDDQLDALTLYGRPLDSLRGML